MAQVVKLGQPDRPPDKKSGRQSSGDSKVSKLGSFELTPEHYKVGGIVLAAILLLVVGGWMMFGGSSGGDSTPVSAGDTQKPTVGRRARDLGSDDPDLSGSQSSGRGTSGSAAGQPGAPPPARPDFTGR